MLTLHHLATTYHTRPSQLLQIDDGYTAYQFDLAVLWWASNERKKQLRKQGGAPSINVASGAGVVQPDGRIRIPVSKEQAKKT